jgi:hypothetical protein
VAAFQEHVSIAVLSSGVMIVPFHSMGLLTIEQSLVALFLGILGGISPDLDSDTSKPIRSVFRIFSITLPLVLLLSISADLSIVQILLIWGLSGLILKIVFFKIFLSLTQHRGIFHTVPMGILFGELVVLVCVSFFHTSIEIAFIYGFFISLGFVVHLLLDELYSVNVLGVRMKKSFGTALKFYDTSNKIGTFILYILIIFIWLFLPSSNELFSSIKQAFETMRLI